MWISVPVPDNGPDPGDGYGSVRPSMARKSGLRSHKYQRTAGFVGLTFAVIALLALTYDSSNEAIAEESVVTSIKPEPGVYMQVWWDTSVDFERLKFWATSAIFDDTRTPWEQLKELIGDPVVSTFAPVVNFPDAGTIQAFIGDQKPSDFSTVICVWRGRIKIDEAGVYNVSLSSSANGAILSMTGADMIVNDIHSLMGEQPAVQRTTNLPAGYRKFVLIWKAPADRADAHVCE